jgi:hypothetical protein
VPGVLQTSDDRYLQRGKQALRHIAPPPRSSTSNTTREPATRHPQPETPKSCQGSKRSRGGPPT